MTPPRLRFVSYSEYYMIIVENLPELSVNQIRQLEAFAEQRRARLDFTNATIRIGKRITFDHFNRTLELCGINADTIESEPLNQIETLPETPIGFGQYKGMSYSELPEDYLLWLKFNYRGRERELVDQELQRRSL